MNAETQPHVVIVGCGFAGLAAARTLARAPLRITMVDRTNHHLFQPLLYQVATAGLAAPAIAAPIRYILWRQRNLTTLLADVARVDAARRRIALDDGEELAYDYLILACGVTHSYFGHDDWAAHAPGLKTLDDALGIRRKILLAYEHAERENDPARRARWLTFVVVGGGPTGVELAGTLAEIAHHTLEGEYRRIDSRNARIVLIEAGARLLPAYPPELSAKALRQLEKLRVETWLRRPVGRIDAAGVEAGGERIEAANVIWAAGVTASPLGAMLGSPQDRAGRVQVTPELAAPGAPGVYVVGDLAALSVNGKPVPGIAPAAKQMGRCAAQNIVAAIEGRPAQAFRYRDYGSMATIGRNAAVAVIGGAKLSGRIAWWCWLVIHIYFLIGFRNRLTVMLDWATAYFGYSRSARIVLGEHVREPPGT